MAGYLVHEVVGFDYGQAILELSHRMTYDRIAEAIGYESKSSIYKILHGAIPAHDHGEALWALYMEVFHVKPKLKVHQRAQFEGAVST